ncbi:type II toxin-antitoxin system PemK/MazF family toxin [Plantactinospora sp. GCM10030261]|uniref:type II toxin-antitoxin system PemK/MazF family toxin n=1 Tax=Plantactinospora sp. GCM10030261 TaxID=3273420 RepID=UPI00361DE2E1
MRRGSILQYLVGSHRLRVVVVTADRYNPAHGLVAPLRERAAPDLAPAFLVPLSRQDWPTAAVIDLSRVRSLDPASVTGPAGQLTQSTLTTLTTAIRSYLGAVD